MCTTQLDRCDAPVSQRKGENGPLTSTKRFPAAAEHHHHLLLLQVIVVVVDRPRLPLPQLVPTPMLPRTPVLLLLLPWLLEPWFYPFFQRQS
jgi:hypothetical protein